MEAIDEIKHNGILLAIIVRKNFNKGGINFISKENFPLQVGINFYKKGEEIKPHFHPKRKIEIKDIQEFVMVEKGKMTVTIYTESGKKVRTTELVGGDMIFLIEGGHGFKIDADTKLSEVKQGPYMGKEVDKKMIE